MPAAPTPLAAMLRRYSNDLYRLALLLTNTAGEAEAALLGAARQLAGAPDDPRDELALIGALVAALPPERRRAPEWAARAAPEDAALLQGFARLPRPQRLALALLTLHDAAPDQIAALLGAEPAEAAAQLRDGLAALAPAGPAEPPAELPEVCQAARAALGLSVAAPPADPSVRGHLALCDECRAVAQTWQQARAGLGEALRRTLRPIELPPALGARMHALLATEPAQPLLGRLPLSHPWVRRAAVPLAVLLVIAALVLPRPQLAAPTGAPGPSLPAQPPRALVERAIETLYAPPAGQGLWHGRWEIRWAFADGSYALLHAQLWRASDAAQHRAQLAHRDGGSPYEFQLASAGGRTHYAITEKYAPSLYPLVFDHTRNGVELSLTAEQRRSMLAARLTSGAWALAADYLRQAQAAGELRSWGRQPAADGQRLDVIGFLGESPLLPPADAHDASGAPVTVLLSIDPLSGRLYQIDELHGPPGGAQTHRVVWRFLGDEWLEGQPAADALALRSAWNGQARFSQQAQLADPALPLAEADRTLPLSQMIAPQMAIFPARPPAGATAALAISPGQAGNRSPIEAVLFYSGPGRRVALQTVVRRTPRDYRGAELVKFDDRRWAALQPGPGRQYRATLVDQGAAWLEPDRALVTTVSALGLTRAELLAVVESVGMLSPEGYIGQAHLFNPALQAQGDAGAALLAAVERPPAPTGQLRHTVERLSFRRDSAPDRLPDPYHQPRYAGYPAEITRESWRRAAGMALASVERDDAGKIYGRSYTDKRGAWHHNLATGSLISLAGADTAFYYLDRGQRVALHLLACAGARLERQPDGARVITYAEENWVRRSCVLPDYSRMWLHQNTGGTVSSPSAWGAESPYLAGLEGGPLSVRLELGPDGDAVRYSVYVGATQAGAPVETWEKLRDELIPAAQAPADAPGRRLPEAPFVLDYSTPADASLAPARPTTVDAARRQVATPLLTIAQESDVGLMSVEVASTPQPGLRLYADNPLESALHSGYAVRFTYIISQAEWLRVYQGEAGRLAAYLRSGVFWLDSQPRTLTVAGRTLPAWRVIAADRSRWLLAEVDGTLLAVEARTDTQLAAAAGLRGP